MPKLLQTIKNKYCNWINGNFIKNLPKKQLDIKEFGTYDKQNKLQNKTEKTKQKQTQNKCKDQTKRNLEIPSFLCKSHVQIKTNCIYYLSLKYL